MSLAEAAAALDKLLVRQSQGPTATAASDCILPPAESRVVASWSRPPRLTPPLPPHPTHPPPTSSSSFLEGITLSEHSSVSPTAKVFAHSTPKDDNSLGHVPSQLFHVSGSPSCISTYSSSCSPKPAYIIPQLSEKTTSIQPHGQVEGLYVCSEDHKHVSIRGKRRGDASGRDWMLVRQSLRPADRSKIKTELCRSYQVHGRCRYGMRCNYAHGLQQLREATHHGKYKTRNCKSYHETGCCRYGSRCSFIHDPEEGVLKCSITNKEGVTEIEEGVAAP